MTNLSKTTLLSITAIALLLSVAACSPLQTINALTSQSSYVKTTDLAYGDDARQRLDIYTPRDLAGSAPVVLFFYGGSWNSGKRADYAFVGAALAARGMVAVLADYRLYPQVHYPEILDDSARALAWVTQHVAQYGGDPKRLFVMGHSAGAYNAAMLALDGRLLRKYQLTPALLRGWIGIAGPYDFIPIENPDVRPVFFYPDTPTDSQPINHVSASAPPALLIAPRHDKLVDPLRNTAGMAARLRQVGVSVDEQYFAHTDHMTLIATLAWPLRRLAPLLDQIERFVAADGGRSAYAALPSAASH